MACQGRVFDYACGAHHDRGLNVWIPVPDETVCITDAVAEAVHRIGHSSV
ncbi:hypothetical protein [Mycobacterium haemophilum]|nr:hypothetical protein [Mycobacterium haemophilum]MCV7339576.1 hypothetical protein [Mycobacterium haemophilum DSM 44634]